MIKHKVQKIKHKVQVPKEATMLSCNPESITISKPFRKTVSALLVHDKNHIILLPTQSVEHYLFDVDVERESRR